MKIVYNSIIPFKGFLAINLFGVMFVRKEYKEYSKSERFVYTINHESIHTRQMRELLYVLFYVLYGLEYIVRLFQYKFDVFKAYKNISFEREAYKFEKDLTYLSRRKWFAQWR